MKVALVALVIETQREATPASVQADILSNSQALGQQIVVGGKGNFCLVFPSQYNLHSKTKALRITFIAMQHYSTRYRKG